MIYHEGFADLEGLQEAVDETAAALKKVDTKFDSIVVTGMSGVIVGVPVSLAIGKPLVIVRKEGDKCHHEEKKLINESALGKRSVFLDDFIAQGKTLQHVLERVTEHGGTIVGKYLYCDRRLYFYNTPLKAVNPNWPNYGEVREILEPSKGRRAA